MAGLGVARTFAENGYDDFRLITDSLGGKVVTSDDGKTNYGAFYVRSDYEYLLPLVTKKQRLRVRDTFFVNGDNQFRIFSLSNIFHLFSAVRGVLLLLKFSRRYRELRRRCEVLPPKEALAQDSWAYSLHNQSASDFIRQHGLEFWADRFFNPIVRATAFLDISEVNASAMLTSLLPIVVPSWKFTLDFHEVMSPLSGNVVTGVTVVAIKKEGDQWTCVDAHGGVYRCRNLVLALPITTTRELLNLDEPVNMPVRANVVHVRGELKKEFQGSSFVFFSADSPDLWITKEDSGTYLFYTTQVNGYDLSQYFSDYEIIEKCYWDPAFFLGPYITDIDRGDNLYVVGGHNFASMEDAYISGVYAARKIVRSN